MRERSAKSDSLELRKVKALESIAASLASFEEPLAKLLFVMTHPPRIITNGEGDEFEQMFGPNPTPAAPPVPDGIGFADEWAVQRHAEKQGVSWSDAWRYFEREGYDMSQVDGQYDHIEPMTDSDV